MDLLSFVPEQLMILVVVIYLVGYLLKTTKYVKDNLIPIILVILGMIFSCALQKELSALAILQGIICWGVAVGVNQSLKQMTKLE